MADNQNNSAAPRQAPPVPPQAVPGAASAALEEYVRSRVLQCIQRFAQALSQAGVSQAVLNQAMQDTLRSPLLFGQVPLQMQERRQPQLQLVFRHDCQALGCLEPQCVLCQHTSKRRCTVNFCNKYCVSDRMLAKCGAQIRVEVVDRATGRLCESSQLSDVLLEVFVLNGASYDQRFLNDASRPNALARADSSSPDSVAALNRDLDACALLSNKKGKPLLVSLAAGGAAKTAADGKLLIQAVRGRVVLSDLTVTDSSEALLSGRKPPFRLVVRACARPGQQQQQQQHTSLRPAVSEAFVVATRRVRTQHKADIPTVDEPIAKLIHMGKETCRKLADLQAAAQQAHVDLQGLGEELRRIDKISDFKALALRAESDGQLRQTLQALLKLPKDKWDECVSHAKRAVFPDRRLRAWYADTSSSLGLLFPADLGVVDLKRPEAMLQRVADPGQPGASSRLQVITQQQQTPAQRDTVRQLLPKAEEGWWAAGHKGWTLFDPQQATPGPAAQASPSPPPQQLAAAGPVPVAAAAGAAAGASSNGLRGPSPAAAPAAAPGMPLAAAFSPHLLRQYVAATNMAAGLQRAAAAAAGAPGGAATSTALPPVPALDPHSLHQQQQPAAHAYRTLQQTISNSSYPATAWMTNSAATTQQQHHHHQQALPVAAAAAASTPPRPASGVQQQGREAPSPAGTAAPKTPALASAFAALAAQPITGAGDSPRQTPPAAAGAGAAATSPSQPAATAAAAARAGRPDPSSSGLESSLQHSRSSGVSWLPPLAGRKRSSGCLDTTAAGRVAAGAAAPPSSLHAAPPSQLSADMEQLLTAAGFTPSAPPPAAGPSQAAAVDGTQQPRRAPSLAAFPSMSLFVDTVSPHSAAAGGGTGVALLYRPQAAGAAGAAGAAAAAAAGAAAGAGLSSGGLHNRSASAGLSRLLSLDLASLLRGTSLLLPAPVGPAVAAAAAGGGGGGGGGGPAGLAIKVEPGEAGNGGGGGGAAADGDGQATPHSAAAAAGLMALADDTVLVSGGGGTRPSEFSFGAGGSRAQEEEEGGGGDGGSSKRARR